MSRDKKLPALQFYPGDWRKSIDVQSLSFHDRGVWFEMLMLMHDSERRGVLLLNGAAMTDEMIARAIGLDNQTFNQTLTTLLTTGVASREEETGAVTCRRMVRDEGLRQIRALAGKQGGNPALLKQIPTTQVKQIPTPSSSFSSSSSEEGGGADDDIPPEAVATRVFQETGTSNRWAHRAITDVARSEQRRGESMTKLSEAMIAAWNDFSANRAQMAHTVTMEKFFGEKLWQDRKAWPWKSGSAPQQRPAIKYQNPGGHVNA